MTIQLNEDEQRKIKALEKAKRYLNEYRDRTICGALTSVGMNYRYLHSTAKQLQSYVMRSLVGHVFYENWVYANTGQVYNSEQSHAGRIAWIDAMIRAIETQSEVSNENI